VATTVDSFSVAWTAPEDVAVVFSSHPASHSVTAALVDSAGILLRVVSPDMVDIQVHG
jgi:hypothetical protein